MVGTQGTGIRQGPRGHPDGGEQGTGREGDAPTAACWGCRGARGLGSAFPWLGEQGSHAAWHLQGRAWPWLPPPPTVPRGSGTSPSSAGPSTLQPHAVGCRSWPVWHTHPPPPANAALCSPVTMLSHLLINQADCNVFLGH